MELNRYKSLVKRNKFLYRAYYYVMSLSVNIMKLFLKGDDKLILFVGFGGRRFTGCPKAIYDYMKNDARFKDYKLVWGFIHPEDYPDVLLKVKIDTYQYYKSALKARCWITNVLIERALNFTGINTFYLYTDHGGSVKKGGIDDINKSSFTSLAKYHYSAIIAQSEFEKNVRSKIFSVNKNEVYLTGQPRNDVLANYSSEYRNKIREELGITVDEVKAVLYAPTFREYSHVGAFETPVVDFFKWHEYLGDNYVILYRAHPAISGGAVAINEKWFIDVTKYDNLESLMIASDVLVSDYSGLIVDYSILDKPICLWLYDYNQYKETRGLYIDVKEELPNAINEGDLLKMIKAGQTEEQRKLIKAFQHKYATYYGNASKNATDLVYKKLQKAEK